ncbi:MAG: DNRLRE domain-containing protein, partial [Acidobacteria bacterium]|nr:DNRLRE domain-containing protein [Acidobacteriota bacterium]
MCTRALLAMAAVSASVLAASAQTTVILNDSRPDVVYATLRAGAYADSNLPTVLTTRAADTSANNHRRALLKFDTQNRIPAGSSVTSALLTVTVKSGSTADTTRTIGAYQVTTSWAEAETTWNRRRTASGWMSGGGDLGTLITKQVVSNAAGTKVTFDVTSLVKAAVAGKLGSSRYTR